MSTKTTRDSLMGEEPKIDSALKSFVSFWIAHFSLQQEEAQPKQSPQTTPTSTQRVSPLQAAADPNTALACTRSLSKAINAHVMAIHVPRKSGNANNDNNHDKEEERELVERVWNEVAAMPGSRITKSLGRTCLSHAWSNDLKDAAMTLFLQQQPQQQQSCAPAMAHTGAGIGDTDNENKNDEDTTEWIMQEYLRLFERLLLQPSSDAQLVWSVDKGQAELARRAAQRVESAQARVLEQQARIASATTTPTIEEIHDNEDNGE